VGLMPTGERLALERKLKRQLDKARIVDGGVDDAEAWSAVILERHAVLCVIEEVEELSAEVQTHISARQRELLDEGEVGVDESSPG